MLEYLGKYKITEEIGRGAMGMVFKAFDPQIRRTVAIKTIRKELLEHSEAASLLARFKNEAQAAGRISHPGIIAVYDYDEEQSLAYIVMEYVQGSGLDQYFKRGTRFAARDLVSIMAQLLDALDFAHEQGVVHRDIKPANLMLMVNGRLKVADFGIARIDASELTQVGIIMGTPGYMAPEQYTHQGIDRRADVFSAGVIFYQLLAGAKPFTGSNELIYHRIVNENPPPPSQLQPDRELSHFDSVVAKALAKKPEDRYQTALEFREAILSAHHIPVSPSVSEETIIYDISTVNRPVDATSPSRPSTGSLSLGTTGFPPGWDLTILKQVEQQLTQIVGPVARVMIKRAARMTTDLEKLYQILADDIANGEDRTSFLSKRGVVTTSTDATKTPLSSERLTAFEQPGEQLNTEVIERATRQLAVYLGPIAKVLAKKAAAKATDARSFHLLMADSLPTESEKQAFLKSVGV